MKIMAFGKKPSGELLFPPMDEEAVTRALVASLPRNAPALEALTTTTSRGVAFRGEMKPHIPNPNDPSEAGWSYMVAEGDPQRSEIVDILKPLAQHRGMEDPADPLVFGGGAPDTWNEWLDHNYYAPGRSGKRVPHYILMVGGPDRLPFRFQSLMDVVACVGRVQFDSLDDLDAYVKKLRRLEEASDPVVERQVVMFAPDAGDPDPTYFSRKYMAQPLGEHIRQQLGFATTALLGEDATKEKLACTLRGAKPALVYTASHGLGCPADDFGMQLRYNGAICCQASESATDWFFSADDVPTDEPFLEGAVLFQFACYGYGTLARSDYAQWLPEMPAECAQADFIAALPKCLLAHPRGPIAYVGHVDTALLHGFTDPDDRYITARWHDRVDPFVDAVKRLLTRQPSALAMERMNERYDFNNGLLTNHYHAMERGEWAGTAEEKQRLVDTWIFRSDAQNYMLFGDPAAHLWIPES